MNSNQGIKFCCQNMEYYIDEKIENLVDYKPHTRGYRFSLYYDNKKSDVKQSFDYCPWCGTKLPKDLDEEWGEALEKEYGLTSDDFFDESGNWDESRIPKEFRTDEWWKKRGL